MANEAEAGVDVKQQPQTGARWEDILTRAHDKLAGYGQEKAAEIAWLLMSAVAVAEHDPKRSAAYLARVLPKLTGEEEIAGRAIAREIDAGRI